MKYRVLLAKKHYVEFIIEAKDTAEALEKAKDEDYIEVIEDEYLLPSTEYKVEDIIEESETKGKV